MEHVVLTGLPGSGKTSVGSALAQLRGWPFLDLDEAIVATAGKPIPTLFAESGERGFRALEQFVFEQLGALDRPTVVATGGGTVASPDGLRSAAELGTSVWLSVAPAIAAARLAGNNERPLLRESDGTSGDPERKLGALLERRASFYGRSNRIVDGLGEPTEVADRVEAALLRPEQVLQVGSSRGDYPIRVFAGDAEAMAVQIAAFATSGRAVLIVDRQVAFKASAIGEAMGRLGIETSLLAADAGESLKRLTALESLALRLSELGCDRETLLVAVGGGSLGDAVGFAAATYLRGVRWITVPTTLLGMVDSAIGGKVGVNLGGAKNLLGAFYPPQAVLSNVAWLETLGIGELRSGMAEMLKVAATHDLDYFAELSAFEPRRFARAGDAVRVIAKAAALKADVVTADEHEAGLRAVLNFGHTFGHAFEAGAGLGVLRHGEAVALGMLAVTEFAIERGAASREVLAALTFGLEAVGLPRDWRSLAHRAIAFLGQDKKRQGSSVKLVVVPKLGQFEWLMAELTDLKVFLEREGVTR